MYPSQISMFFLQLYRELLFWVWSLSFSCMFVYFCYIAISVLFKNCTVLYIFKVYIYVSFCASPIHSYLHCWDLSRLKHAALVNSFKQIHNVFKCMLWSILWLYFSLSIFFYCWKSMTFAVFQYLDHVTWNILVHTFLCTCTRVSLWCT